MKPLVIMITDTHLKEENIQTVVDAFSEAMVEALSRDMTTVYCLGDVFESRKGQLSKLLSAFEDVLDLYQDNGVTLVSCVGNHDKTDYSHIYSFLSPFRHHPAFHLVSVYETFQIDENTTFSLLSFFDDVLYLQYITKLKEQLAQESPGKRHLLGTHIGISGVRMHSGEEFKSEKINKEIFSFFDSVYVGHFHDAGQYFNNVNYIGSAFQHNYGEDMDKGLSLINSYSKDGKDDFYCERILLPSAPKYRKIEIAVNDITEKEIANLTTLKQDYFNDHIRVVLVGTEAEIKSFDKSSLMSVGIDVKVKTNKIDRLEVESNVHMFDNENIKSQFNIFCEKLSLDLVKGKSYLDKIVK